MMFYGGCVSDLVYVLGVKRCKLVIDRCFLAQFSVSFLFLF